MLAGMKGSPLRASQTRLDDWSPGLIKSRLYHALLMDIIIGALPPGQQLDENQLAGRYGGGLAGVREALARLALEGLVQRKARVGTTVAALDLDEAREAYQARCLVESECAALAALHAGPSQIAAIRATMAGGETAVEANDHRALAEMDEAFHVAVAAASGNRTLAKMVVTLHHQTARYWLHAMRAPSMDESRAALAEHRALADVIALGEPDKARRAMLALLGDFPGEVARSLEAGGLEASGP
jgi:DNA-binding GntR family transcriptional regulator